MAREALGAEERDARPVTMPDEILIHNLVVFGATLVGLFGAGLLSMVVSPATGVALVRLGRLVER